MLPGKALWPICTNHFSDAFVFAVLTLSRGYGVRKMVANVILYGEIQAKK